MSINLRPRVFGRPTEVTSPMDDVPVEAPAEGFRDEMPVLGDSLVDVESEVYSSVTLRLPQSLYDEYRRVAAAQDQTVEEVLQHRISACKSHNALRGIWFSDSERSQLENLIQKWPIDTAVQVLKLLANSGTISLDGLEISLTPAQKRVVSLAMYGGRTPKSFFEAMIKRELRV